MRGQGLKGLYGPVVYSIVFIAVTVAATALLAASITDTTSGDRATYYAKFTDVAGLHTGQGVRIAGVRVGQVDAISISDRRLAKVTFSVDRDRDLPRSVVAAVKYLNLVGGRYVELTQGAGPPGDVLRPGGTIPVSQTVGPLNLTQLFEGFQPLMQALSPGDANRLSESVVQVLQGEGGTVDSLLRTVGSLSTTIAGKDKVIGDVITNLNAVLDTVNARDAQLVDLIRTLRAFTSGLAADRGEIGTAFTALDDLTNATASLLQEGRAPLSDSIRGLDRLSTGLNKNQATLDRFLSRWPDKMSTLGRISSYGSWVNFYQCEVTLTGVHNAGADIDTSAPPSGIPLTDARCRR